MGLAYRDERSEVGVKEGSGWAVRLDICSSGTRR